MAAGVARSRRRRRHIHTPGDFSDPPPPAVRRGRGPQKLTVVTFKWQGWRSNLYDHRHVNALGRMLEKHLSLPYKFVCITDDPMGVEYDTMPLWEDPVVLRENNPCPQNCYRRLKLFSKEAVDWFGGGYVLHLDLDTLVFGKLNPLVEGWESLRFLKGARTHYNGSMWMLRLGAHTNIWEKFDPVKSPKTALSTREAVRRRWQGSDQVWFSYIAPRAPVWTHHDGAWRCEGYFHSARQRAKGVLPKHGRIVFFPGPPHRKPWQPEFQKDYPELSEAYMEYFDA